MEIVANALQTVATNQNVVFTDDIVSGNCSILHRDNSGLITLKGNGTQCRARYKVTFGANIAVPTGGTAGPISLAIAIEGEPVASTTMAAVPAAAGDFWNVFSAIYLEVPKGCCMTIGVENTSTQTIAVTNANLIAERVA